MIASVDSAEVSTAPRTSGRAANQAASAQAVENCVPLISASPSLGPSVTGVRPACARASAAVMRVPPSIASPSPIIVSAMCASGARSPEAPTEPCTGTTGVTPCEIMPSRSAQMSHRTPEAPRPSDRSFRAIINRTVSGSSTSPTPQQWDRIRLRCKVAVSAAGILTEASLPKPVLTP